MNIYSIIGYSILAIGVGVVATYLLQVLAAIYDSKYRDPINKIPYSEPKVVPQECHYCGTELSDWVVHSYGVRFCSGRCHEEYSN